jgi:hypothetical protein
MSTSSHLLLVPYPHPLLTHTPYPQHRRSPPGLREQRKMGSTAVRRLCFWFHVLSIFASHSLMPHALSFRIYPIPSRAELNPARRGTCIHGGIGGGLYVPSLLMS